MGKSASAKKAQEPPKVQVVGPFLGASAAGEIKIGIGLPHLAHPQVTCIVEGSSGANPQPQTAQRGHGLFGAYSFQFSGLTPGAEYRYRFEAGGKAIELQAGLSPEDCRFRAPSEFSEADSFIVMSCHNPFETKKGSADEGWAMWKALRARIEADPSIRFLVLGGDQLYNDDVEDEYIAKLAKTPDAPLLLDKVRERFTRQYQLFWEDPDYRKVMARMPSIAMWDDHDITDGWGGRLESFEGTEITIGWRRYFELAREAFLAYQAPRNPTPIPGLPNQAQTYHYDFGANRIYMFDHRTERNAEKRVLWSDAHSGVVFDSLRSIPDSIKRVFALCPTVPFRTNFEEDRRLGWLASLLFWYVRGMERREGLRKWLLRLLVALTFSWSLCFALAVLDYLAIISLSTDHVAYGKIALFVGACMLVLWFVSFAIAGVAEIVLRVPELPRLTDDLEDGLSSDANRDSLRELLRVLFSVKREKGKTVTLLSGDIHLAGVSEVVQITKAGTESILQVVSSPVAYQPMPKVVEGFSSTTSEMVVVECEDEKLFARNVFYTSKRNFAQVFPGRQAAGSTAQPFLFFLEGHRVPLAIPTSFLPG